MKFKSAIEPFRDVWKSIDIRAVCLHARDRWFNLGTRLILSIIPPETFIRDEELPRLSSLTAFRELRSTDALDDLLGQFEQGVMHLVDKDICFGGLTTAGTDAVLPRLWFQINRRSDPWIREPLDFSNITLSGSGDRVDDLLRDHSEVGDRVALDWKLRSLAVPYDGLDDLLVNFAGFPKPVWGSVIEATSVQFVAPIPIRFGEQCRLADGRLAVRVEAEAFCHDWLDGVSIGVIEWHRNSPARRGSHELTRGEWTTVSGSLVGFKEVSADDASSASIFLRFRHSAIDALTLWDPSARVENPRVSAYSHFDRDFEELRRYLDGKGQDRSGDFEIGIALLLHFCGLSVGPYGRVKALQEEIDLVAFSPSTDHVIAAECTVTELDKKLSKFARRVKEFRDRLPDFSVLPIMFTALDRGRVPASDLAKARNERIGVASAEEIKELLGIAAEQSSPNASLRYLHGLIPKEEPRGHNQHPPG